MPFLSLKVYRQYHNKGEPSHEFNICSELGTDIIIDMWFCE